MVDEAPSFVESIVLPGLFEIVVSVVLVYHTPSLKVLPVFVPIIIRPVVPWKVFTVGPSLRYRESVGILELVCLNDNDSLVCP
jgi:hypothetical protein